MSYMDTSEPDLTDSLVKYLTGFFGVTAAFLLLPKTAKYMIRRFVLGIVGEVVVVILAGLLTEKAVEKISRQD